MTVQGDSTKFGGVLNWGTWQTVRTLIVDFKKVSSGLTSEQESEQKQQEEIL